MLAQTACPRPDPVVCLARIADTPKSALAEGTPMSPRPSHADRPAPRPAPPQGLSFAFPLRLPENGTGAGASKSDSNISKNCPPPK